MEQILQDMKISNIKFTAERAKMTLETYREFAKIDQKRLWGDFKLKAGGEIHAYDNAIKQIEYILKEFENL